MARSAKDEGVMLILAAFILAAAALVAMGTASLVTRERNDVVGEQRPPLVDVFLDARTEAIAYVHAVWTSDPNATLARRLEAHLQHRLADPLAASLQVRALLAGGASGAGRVEHDGSDTDLVDDDGAYVEPVCAVLDCSGPLLYDNVSDGVVQDARGDALAIVLWLEVSSHRGLVNELVVVGAP